MLFGNFLTKSGEFKAKIYFACLRCKLGFSKFYIFLFQDKNKKIAKDLSNKSFIYWNNVIAQCTPFSFKSVCGDREYQATLKTN